MTEAFRSDRRASAGKFCVWAVMSDGSEERMEEYDTERKAIEAIDRVSRLDVATGVERFIVYDGAGEFRYRLERR